MHTPHVIPLAGSPAAPKPMSAPPRPPVQGRTGFKPDEGGGLRILTYLRLHWLMIAFCGALLGGAGAYAAWELLDSKYESYGLLRVSSVPPSVANQNNPMQARTDFVTYLKTTSALIKSEFVLNAALRDIKDLSTIKSQRDPMKFLDEEVIVTWQDGSEVIRITCKTHEPADSKKIVDAVQNAFMKEVVQQEVKERQDLRGKVEEAMHEIRRILDGKNPNTRDKPVVAKAPNPNDPAALPVGGMAVGGMPNQMPPGQLPPIAPGGMPLAPGAVPVPAAGLPAIPLSDTEAMLIRLDPRILVAKVNGLIQEAERLPISINDGKRRLSILQKKLDEIKNAPPSPRTLEAVEKDHEVMFQVAKTNRAKFDYQFRKGTGDANAPGVLDFKDKWDAQEAKLAEMRKEKADLIESELRIGAAQKIAAEMEGLIGVLQKQQEQYDIVRALLAKSEKQLADLPIPEKGLALDGKEGYRPDDSDLMSTDGIYRRLVQQFYVSQMELHSPARVRPLQAGSAPTQKETKKQIIGTIFAALMGFGLIALGVVAFESSAKRVSSLTDAKTATPLPIVGVIPCMPAEAIGKDTVKRTMANEAIDKLRAYVAQTWLARGATTIAVTSPLGDEGKSFTAFGLASSLAQCGYKTLVVDFDLRDPQLHDFAGVANCVGVCELLRGEIDTSTALQFLPSGLHLLPAGKWSDEARKAATGEKLEMLLSKLRGPYDCVVLHGHPLLTAAESVEVARRCEVVLVCALYRTTTTPLLKRAAERVVTMEIPYSGIVYVGATQEEGLC
jgi:Mrp family chromosome partitioning ATPase